MTPIHQAIAAAEVARDLYSAAVGGIVATENYALWAARKREGEVAASAHLIAGGATVKCSHHADSVSFAGIRASSTQGLFGAIQNWLFRARVKAEKEACA